MASDQMPQTHSADLPPLPKSTACLWVTDSPRHCDLLNPVPNVVNAFPWPAERKTDRDRAYWRDKGFWEEPLFTAAQMRSYGTDRIEALQAQLANAEHGRDEAHRWAEIYENQAKEARAVRAIPLVAVEWVHVDDRVPPDGVLVMTLSKQRSSSTGYSHGYAGWSKDNDSMVDEKQFKRQHTYWMLIPALPGTAPQASVQAAGPMFWVRLRSDGMYEGPIHNAQIEQVRREFWTPLYPHPVAVPPVQAPAEASKWKLPPQNWRVLAKAAIELVSAVDQQHDENDAPLKYTVPWSALNGLRFAVGLEGVAAAPSSPRAPQCLTCNGQGAVGVADRAEPCPDCAPHAPAASAQAVQAPMGGLLQRLMARLADLLDDDQFKGIEQIVKDAGHARPAMQASQVAGEPMRRVIQIFEEARDRCEFFGGIKDSSDDDQCSHSGNRGKFGNWCAIDACPILREKSR